MRAPLFIVALMTVIALAVVTTHAAVDKAALAAERVVAFQQGLNDDQRAKLNIPFDDAAREGFNFLPGDRKGLTLHDMTEEQRKQTHALLEILLSERGYQKVLAIESREVLLRKMEPGNEAMRDPEKFTLAVFGTPGADKPWALRWEGHHLSLNWTFNGGKVIASSPQFMGTNPAEILEGDNKGDRPLAAEEDLARALVKSLDEKQRATCILGDTAPADIISRLESKAVPLEDKGIPFDDLSEQQQGALQILAAEIASVQAPELMMARIERIHNAGLGKVKFAWMGGLEKSQGHYYRIQGPTFLIEYDNTQNNANHAHVVWRDFENDFGRDLLAEHYKAAHPVE